MLSFISWWRKWKAARHCTPSHRKQNSYGQENNILGSLSLDSCLPRWQRASNYISVHAPSPHIDFQLQCSSMQLPLPLPLSLPLDPDTVTMVLLAQEYTPNLQRNLTVGSNFRANTPHSIELQEYRSCKKTNFCPNT